MGIQTRRPDISHLRQKLLALHHPGPEELASFLSGRPLMKGTLYKLRRKCGKPTCRCARGGHHETVVLTASIAGKKKLWTIPEERIEEIRELTEAYRRFRRARAQFLKDRVRRQAAMLRLIDAIEKARTRQP